MATASSGWTPFEGALPNTCVSLFWTTGIRVCPPTSSSSSTRAGSSCASFITRWRISMVRSTSGVVSSSSSLRVKTKSMFSGWPCAVMVTNGTLNGACSRDERSIFTRSARSLIRCIATGSVARSILCYSTDLVEDLRAALRQAEVLVTDVEHHVVPLARLHLVGDHLLHLGDDIAAERAPHEALGRIDRVARVELPLALGLVADQLVALVVDRKD